MPELENSLPEQQFAPNGPENIIPPQVGTSFLAKLKPKWLIVLGALGSIAIFTAIIYAAYSYSRHGQEVQPTPASVSTPTPTSISVTQTTPPQDEVMGWVIYTNQSCGYSVKYPGDWFARNFGTQCKEENPQGPIDVFFIESDFPLDEYPQGIIDVSIFVYDRLSQSAQSKLRDRSNFSKTTFAGVEAWWSEEVGNIYVEKGPYLYVVNGETRVNPNPSDVPIIDQVLFTLKFLEVNDQTKDWGTYTNEKYRYKIQYPPEARTDEERDEYFAVYLGEKGTLVGSYSTLNVQVAENPKGLSRRYFLTDWLREDPESVLANVKIDDAVIGGVDALRVVLDGSWWQGTGAHTVYVVPRGSKMYLIWNDQYWGGRKEPGTVFELNKGTFFKEIEIMLSTFKFLD